MWRCQRQQEPPKRTSLNVGTGRTNPGHLVHNQQLVTFRLSNCCKNTTQLKATIQHCWLHSGTNELSVNTSDHHVACIFSIYPPTFYPAMWNFSI